MKDKDAIEMTVRLMETFWPKQSYEAIVRHRAILEALKWVLDPEIGEHSPYPRDSGARE